MFRRLPSSLPKDPIIPADLEQLGYFLNSSDQIRMIEKPEQKYQFRVNRNDRINDVYKEALNSCVRDIVKDRLLKLGLQVVRLPRGARQDERHVPIYASAGIEHKKRILVVFGERNQELGILSYRSIGENGIKVGSIQEMVEALIQGLSPTSTAEVPGIIITNPGQLIWCRAQGRAMGYNEYLNLTRESAVHGPFRIDPVHNRAPGNSSFTEHVQYIFEHVLKDITDPLAKLDIIGLEYTGDTVIHYLSDNWDAWRGRINGICLGNPQFRLGELSGTTDNRNDFSKFLARRTRAYFVSDKPVETPLPGRDVHGCNCYASGEELYEEGILVKAWKSMLDWFNMISVLDSYEEPVFALVEKDEAGDAN